MPLSIKLNLSNVFTDSADVLADNPAVDDYGHTSSPASVVVATGQPCKLLPYISKKGGSESKAVKKDSSLSFSLFIFPLPVSVENPTGKQIDEHMWVKIAGLRYDVKSAIPPVISGAPSEIFLELIKP